MKIITLQNSIMIELWTKSYGNRNDIWFYLQEQEKNIIEQPTLLVTKVKLRFCQIGKLWKGNSDRGNVSQITEQWDKNERKIIQRTWSKKRWITERVVFQDLLFSVEGSLDCIRWRELWKVRLLGNGRYFIDNKQNHWGTEL